MSNSSLTNKEIQDFLEELSAYRDKNNLSWLGMANKLGVAPSNICCWRNGKTRPHMKWLLRLRDLEDWGNSTKYSTKEWVEASKEEIKEEIPEKITGGMLMEERQDEISMMSETIKELEQENRKLREQNIHLVDMFCNSKTGDK